MRRMMLDPMHLPTNFLGLERQRLCQCLRDVTNPTGVPDSIQHHSHSGTSPKSEKSLPPQVRFRISGDRNAIDISSSDIAQLETPFDGLFRKTGPMLDPPKALLFDGTHKLAVSNQDSRNISMVGVDTEDDH
jgi:hypothetical protein